MKNSHGKYPGREEKARGEVNLQSLRAHLLQGSPFIFLPIFMARLQWRFLLQFQARFRGDFKSPV